MKTKKSGVDDPSVRDAPRSGDNDLQTEICWRGRGSYVSLAPLAAGPGAGDAQLCGGEAIQDVRDDEAPEECAPDARQSLQAQRTSRCALAQMGEEEVQEKAQTDEKIRGDGADWSEGSVSEEDEDEEEDVALFLSAATDDESHYITTHEILLAELSDLEGDRGSSAAGDVEDGSPTDPCVGDAPPHSKGARRAGGARAENSAVSTLRENDPSGSAKSSLSKPQQRISGAGVGQIQLSIRTTSRAINGPGHFLEEGNIRYHATRSGDVSRCALRGAERREAPLRFAAAPERVHLGRKSSGTSSAVSEPDDADKEVRTLTAKTFKSLAHPHFDAVNFGASSESSASERGIGTNSWTALMDMKYGDTSQKLDKTIACRQNSTNSGNRGTILAPGSQICALSAAAPNPASASTAALMGTVSRGQGQGGVITLTETLNFRCNVNPGRFEGENRAQSAPGSRSAEDVPDAPSGGSRRVGHPPGKPKEDTSKKAIFASSLIKNVISKKMQFEQERKMERGEISEQHQASPSEGRAMRRQSSKASETSSDCTLTNAEDPGDAVDAGPGRETTPVGAGTHSEPPAQAANDTKKSAVDASNRTLLHSHNSAFRRWKDGEAEIPKGNPSPERSEGDGCASRGGKLTKMSHLFVPSIQLLPSDRDASQQLQASDRPVSDDGEKARLRSNSTLQVADSRGAVKSRSPEIKINLRSVRNNPTEPAAAAAAAAASKLQMGRNQAATRSKDLRCQTLTAALKGESADKVPHFTVRDIRDNKAKLQTPIHQVRDVRKLVKSSYHFVSLDSDSRLPDPKRQSAGKPSSSVSPIVIKCQSVNTNSGGKLSESRGSESIGPTEADGEHRVVPTRRERSPEPADRRSEPQAASWTALEKLQAAVRTMEQLYVFEKNEWKRKTDAQQLSDTPVASKERGVSEDPAAEADTLLKGRVTAGKTPAPTSTAGSRSALNLRTSGESAAAQAHAAAKSSPSKSAKAPKANTHEGARTQEWETATQESDNENYLALPVKPQAGGEPQVSVFGAASRSPMTPPRPLQVSPGAQEDLRQASDGTGVAAEARLPEIPLAAVYHSSPQLLCLSPAIAPAPALEPLQALQRKILLDPTTGSYYLVDSPMPPPTKRLFDPETGQYVDIAMPQPPTTPVPMSVSPLALGSAAYGHAYMIYPGFVPTPSVISAQMSLRSEGESSKMSQYVDTPFYIATGKCAQPPLGAQQQTAPSVPLQPIISISSQQGPRIIAPPSFDGTTMSFVVEHR